MASNPVSLVYLGRKREAWWQLLPCHKLGMFSNSFIVLLSHINIDSSFLCSHIAQLVKAGKRKKMKIKSLIIRKR